VSDKTLEKSPEREAQVRERAYRLWEEEGRPHGRDVEYWERAREFVAAERNRTSAAPEIVSPDPAAEVEAAVTSAAGEESAPLTEQGDRPQAPRTRRKR
jgi:Protein of unknown function (DUF2934)